MTDGGQEHAWKAVILSDKAFNTFRNHPMAWQLSDDTKREFVSWTQECLGVPLTLPACLFYQRLQTALIKNHVVPISYIGKLCLTSSQCPQGTREDPMHYHIDYTDELGFFLDYRRSAPCMRSVAMQIPPSK